MASFETLFHIAAFIAGLSLLERGAKLFVESTTDLAKRLRLPEVLVAILIAGAEWEELAVVSLSIAQQRPALAVGNVVGSSVANILGAFALGLVFSGAGKWDSFDRTSKLATRGLLGYTTFVWLFALAHIMWNRVVASLLIISFALYLFVVLWTIWQAMFYNEDHERDDVETAAAHDDAASSSSSSSSSSSEDGRRNHFLDRHRHFVDRHFLHRRSEEPNETTTLLGVVPAPEGYDPKMFHHTLTPALKVLGGFAALTVSGFILSRTSIHLATALNMSDSAFGATFLSLATTLPEKFLAVMSSSKGHTGLMVADAVGSNMFLLTLCLGITAWSIAAHDWHDHDSEEDGGFAYVDIARIEAWWLWMATIALTVIVNFGGKLFAKFASVRHVLGILMLMGYGGFLAIEFTILREE